MKGKKEVKARFIGCSNYCSTNNCTEEIQSFYLEEYINGLTPEDAPPGEPNPDLCDDNYNEFLKLYSEISIMNSNDSEFRSKLKGFKKFCKKMSPRNNYKNVKIIIPNNDDILNLKDLLHALNISTEPFATIKPSIKKCADSGKLVEITFKEL